MNINILKMKIIDDSQPYEKLDNVEGYENLFYTNESTPLFYEPFTITSIGPIHMNLIEAYTDYLKYMTYKDIEYDVDQNIQTKSNLITFYISPNVPLYVMNDKILKYKENMGKLDKFSIQCPDCKFKKAQLEKFGNIIFKNIDTFSYIDGSTLEKEKFEFIRYFVKMFKDKSIYYSYEYEETFHFNVMTVVDKEWEPELQVKEVLKEMRKRKHDKTFKFMVIKNSDISNIEKVNKGEMPLFSYPDNLDIQAGKYLVLRAYIEICNENPESYPFCTPDRLLNLISSDLGFEAPDYKIAEMVYKRLNLIDKITCVEFEEFDNILVKYMYLISKEDLKPLLIYSGNSYYVCYSGVPYKVDNIPYDILRTELISYFDDPDNNFLYKSKEINEVVKFTYDDEEPLFMDEVFYGDYKNPKTDNFLGYLFWETYDNNYYGIYKSIMGEGYMPRPQRYNADLTNDKVKVVKLSNGSCVAKYDDIEISEQMIIDPDNLQQWCKAFKRWWSIGLFMTTYGLCFYKKTNQILKKCVKKSDFLKYPLSIVESYEVLKFMESY